jgi:hypothetical protein
MNVRLDLNNPDFQKECFSLQKEAFISTKNTLRKLSSMDWNQVYHDKDLKWEKIQSIKTEKGRELYTIRLSKKYRAVKRRLIRDGALAPVEDFPHIKAQQPFFVPFGAIQQQDLTKKNARYLF